MDFWSLVIFVIVVVSVGVVSVLLPSVLLEEKTKHVGSKDVGLKVFKEPSGESIVYRPFFAAKFVPQYVLSKRKGKKVLVLNLAPDIFYAEYDIEVYDNLDKYVTTLSVKEIIRKSGVTSEIELPAETSYISLKLKATDKRKLVKAPEQDGKLPLKRIALFALAATAVTLIEVVCINASLAISYGGVFADSFLDTANGAVSLIITAVIVGALNVAVAVLQTKHVLRKFAKWLKL